jgi:hypothetical protein
VSSCFQEGDSSADGGAIFAVFGGLRRLIKRSVVLGWCFFGRGSLAERSHERGDLFR